MVPAYGDGPLIREAIGSVLAQDDNGWRLTVIDDAAATESGQLAQWLQGLGDPRVRYLANPQRLGINRNFQRCADESSADWVVILGADDRLLPSFISRVRKETTEFPDTAWIHAGARIIDDNGHPHLPMADRVKHRTMPKISRYREIAGEELAVSLLKGNWMYFPSCAFQRTMLQKIGFRPGYDIVLDLDLYLHLLLAGGTCILLEQPGIEYRRHAASLSSTGAHDGSRFAEEIAYFDEMVPRCPRSGGSGPRRPRAGTGRRECMRRQRSRRCCWPGTSAAAVRWCGSRWLGPRGWSRTPSCRPASPGPRAGPDPDDRERPGSCNVLMTGGAFRTC